MGPKPQCYIPKPKVIGPLAQEKKIFKSFFFTIYGSGGYLGHVTQMPRTNFRSPMEASHEIWLRLAQRFWRRRSLKMVDGRTTTDNGRTTEQAYTISSPMSLTLGSGELIKYITCLYVHKIILSYNDTHTVDSLPQIA